MSSLEARTRTLLRFYPPSYRYARGEEMLGTVLEASPPGRNWPAPRDALSLIAGGLRARSAQNRRLPLGTSLRLTLILGAVLWLSAMPATTLMHYEPFWPRGVYAAYALLLVATIAAPWFTPRGVTISLALVTAVALGLLAYHDGYGPQSPVGLASFVVPPLVLAAAAGAEPLRPPRSWLCLPGAMAVAATLFYSQDMVVRTAEASSIAGTAGTVIEFGLLGATALWLTADARPAIALVIAFELAAAPNIVAAAVEGNGRTSHIVMMLAVLAAGGLAIVRIRRKAVL